jgi:hypothetical protein
MLHKRIASPLPSVPSLPPRSAGCRASSEAMSPARTSQLEKSSLSTTCTANQYAHQHSTAQHSDMSARAAAVEGCLPVCLSVCFCSGVESHQREFVEGEHVVLSNLKLDAVLLRQLLYWFAPWTAVPVSASQ